MLYSYGNDKSIHAKEFMSIPMCLLNEKRAKLNHSQSLDKLNERGGLSPKEAYAIIKDVNLNQINHNTIDKIVAELKELSDSVSLHWDSEPLDDGVVVDEIEIKVEHQYRLNPSHPNFDEGKHFIRCSDDLWEKKLTGYFETRLAARPK